MTIYYPPFSEIIPMKTALVIYGDWLRDMGDDPPVPIKRYSNARMNQDAPLSELLEYVLTSVNEYLLEPVTLNVERIVTTDEGLLIVYEGMDPKHLPTEKVNPMAALKALIRAYIIKVLAEAVAAEVIAEGALSDTDKTTIDGVVASV